MSDGLKVQYTLKLALPPADEFLVKGGILGYMISEYDNKNLLDEKGEFKDDDVTNQHLLQVKLKMMNDLLTIVAGVIEDEDETNE